MSSSQQSEPPVTVSHTEPATPAAAVFRIQPLALSAVALFLFGVTFPVAGNPPLFGWLLIFPILAGYWVLRVRTIVTPENVRVRKMVGSTTVAWSDVAGVRFPSNGGGRASLGWGRLARSDGGEVTLPAVTVDDLPRLSRASGGAVPDPTPPPAPEPAEDTDNAEPAVERDDGADPATS